MTFLRCAVLVLAVLLALPPAAVAAKSPSCRQRCKMLERACAGDAREKFASAKASCRAGGGGDRRTCRSGAKRTRRSELRACRTATRETCRPCCKAGGFAACAREKAAVLVADPQVEGDPVEGRRLLLNGDYMTCGAPARLWDVPALRPLIAGAYGSGADAPTLPGREGRNAELPYFLNAFTAPNGAEVVNANCLMCHGGTFDGELVIGLGNPVADFTRGAGGGLPSGPLPEDLLDLLGLDAAERAQLETIAARGAVLGPETMMRTIGMNPAELFAVILMVHHDRDTLAWSDEPLAPVVPRDRDGNPLPDRHLTSDPPPWWRVHKKAALFYNGMARGDHRGTMALATSVCVDSVERAREVDEMFVDIQAFVKSVRPPTYRRPIGEALAAEGREVFDAHCATCHGTYAEREEDETYPNLLVPLDVIGTDPAVAEAGVVHTPELVEWYNGSFYGQITQMRPADPFAGYMPPPLDGIWATAPFLHNGSVPTIELVLNSRARPRRWRREDLESTHFDETAVGWPWIEVPVAQADAPADERALVYDTTLFGQSNAGHTFGDHLTPEERRAVLEYLKTL